MTGTKKIYIGAGILVFLALLVALLLGLRVEKPQADGPAVEQKEAQAATTGPLGWVVQCNFDQHADLDPIVGTAAHKHAFFGGHVDSNAETPADLRQSPTTCGAVQDRAAYWIPAVSRQRTDGTWERLTPDNVHAYYRASKASGTLNQRSQLFPQNLEAITGDPNSTGAQPHIFYSCTGGGGDGSTLVNDEHFVNCSNMSPDIYPTAVVNTGDCYKDTDGDGIPNTPTAADGSHKNHVVYSTNFESGGDGTCPANYIPGVRLKLDFRFPSEYNNRIAGATLSSGPPTTMHADFMDGWNRTAATRLRDFCIRDNTGCTPSETIDVAAGNRTD